MTVRFFPGTMRCPLAGVGRRGERECIRVVTYQPGSTIEHSPGRLVWTHAQSLAQETDLGHVTVLGTGMTRAGGRVPLAVRVKVRKQGSSLTTQAHVLPVVREPPVSFEVEPLTISLRSGAQTHDVVVSEIAREAVRDPVGVAAKLGSFLDIVENATPPSPGERVLSDLTIALTPAGVVKPVLQARLVSLDPSNDALLAGGSLGDILARGQWELRVTSLSRLLPQESLLRELRQLGLEGLPSLQAIFASGLPKEQPLVVRYRAGAGVVAFQGAEDPLPDALDVARRFLEFDPLGAIMAYRLQSGAR